MREEKPPLAIEVQDAVNLARLIMNEADAQPLFWFFHHRGRSILGSIISIPYWYGSLPIFAYTSLLKNLELKGYIAYTSLGAERMFFSESMDDNRYLYAPVVEVESPPRLLLEALSSRCKLRVKPVPVRAKNLFSLLRVIMIMSDNLSSPPVWHYEVNERRHILGVVTPFYDYYDARALPVFFYVEVEEMPGPFIKYQAISREESVGYAPNISDMKHLYGRVITIKEMPFLSLRRKSRKRLQK